jgi:hypothetical protein
VDQVSRMSGDSGGDELERGTVSVIRSLKVDSLIVLFGMYEGTTVEVYPKTVMWSGREVGWLPGEMLGDFIA